MQRNAERRGVAVHYARHPVYRRALYSFMIVASVVSIGTLGIHYLEGYSYVESFFFISMLATGEGPPVLPATSAGKIFSSLMAFISIGTVVFALSFILGPFLGRLFRAGWEKLEEEERILSKGAKKR